MKNIRNIVLGVLCIVAFVALINEAEKGISSRIPVADKGQCVRVLLPDTSRMVKMKILQNGYVLGDSIVHVETMVYDSKIAFQGRISFDKMRELGATRMNCNDEVW